MKELFLAALIAAASDAHAQAERRHVLHGLFCNTEAQIDQSLTHLSLKSCAAIGREVDERGKSCMCFG